MVLLFFSLGFSMLSISTQIYHGPWSMVFSCFCRVIYMTIIDCKSILSHGFLVQVGACNGFPMHEFHCMWLNMIVWEVNIVIDRWCRYEGNDK
jgi:hypothetical protein